MAHGNAYTAVFRREVMSFGQNRVFMLLSVVLPVVAFLFFVVIFKTGVPTDLPIAVLDNDKTALSRQLTRMFDATPSASVDYGISDMQEGERMMKEGMVDAIIEIPRDMEKNVYSNSPTTVNVYISGLNLTKNGLLNKDLQTVLISFSAGIRQQTMMKRGISKEQAANLMLPLYFERHVLFNPFINYSYYLLPCFLPLMLMLFAILTAVFSIGNELKNRTAKEWLDTAKGNAVAALAGKLTPYTIIFFVLCFFMNTILYRYMGIPLRGSLPMMFVSGLVFVLASQSVGVFIITLFSNMRLGLSIGGGYSVLAFTFSGLTFPFLAMGTVMQTIGLVFPLTYYMEIFIDQAMRGAPFVYSADHLGYMMIFLLLPLVMLPRLHRICTNAKFWGRL